MKRRLWFFPCLLLLLFLSACTRHEIDSRHQVAVAPVEVKPIHITIDVNIRVDRALDDFFGDLDKTADKIKPAPAAEK